MTSTPDLSKTQSSPGLPSKEVPTSAAPYSHLLLRFAEDGPCRRTGIRPHPRLTKCTVTRLRSTPAGTNQSALDRPQPSPAPKGALPLRAANLVRICDPRHTQFLSGIGALFRSSHREQRTDRSDT
ncbi:hypothetical protein GTY87_00700 [Streptomyces sp. SID7813]|uniref:Uncharacterized protein n=1 Tax=Streptomyces coelicolor (strain ATCC BAA-471 / A3(2) / M145) TaxID=100226 RepID=Q9RJ08_STRCO|nr:hypothetical protein [Streptomyces sp. SID7813]QFI40461.1 hypothetical protein FQ762_00720 [Streptomyces coelicolor A3(2)]CAB53124.1 hypothetical protein SCJ1.06 [Streptomyces coelicolor A3(2)]